MERLEGSAVASWKRWWWTGVCSAELARWERSEGSEVASWEWWWEEGIVRSWLGARSDRCKGRGEGEVVRTWKGGKSARVVRWQGWKGGRMVK